MFWSSVSTDAAGREVRKAPSRENIKEIRTNIARYGADACNGPNRLTQCVPNSNPLGIIFFVSGISISFKCECHIIIQMQYTKNLNPGRFELGTTLSQPIRSIVRSPHRLPRTSNCLLFCSLSKERQRGCGKKVQEFMPRECTWLLLSKEILLESFHKITS